MDMKVKRRAAQVVLMAAIGVMVFAMGLLAACGSKEYDALADIVPENRREGDFAAKVPTEAEDLAETLDEAESSEGTAVPAGMEDSSETEPPTETLEKTQTEPPTETLEEIAPLEDIATETSAEVTNPTMEPVPEPNLEENTNSETPVPNGSLVVIDAGHQAKANTEKEPIGPGAAETKAKVAGGTRGCVSGLKEYELTLMVSEKLKAELEARGYTVLMVRTSHDVNISNAERAQVANDAQAGAFIRIHANGSENGNVSGAETLCQTASNPYNGTLYQQSRSLSEKVLDGLVNATGAKKRKVAETDTMSGINWCQVPVTIVEMGFMTNEAEDALMATEEYQQRIAQGIADGVDAYFRGE